MTSIWKYRVKNMHRRVSVMAQWVKDPTLSLWGCGFNPWPCSVALWVKDPLLLQAAAPTQLNLGTSICCRHLKKKDLALSLLWLGFDPWPGNLNMLWIQSKKKKNAQEKPKNTTILRCLKSQDFPTLPIIRLGVKCMFVWGCPVNCRILAPLDYSLDASGTFVFGCGNQKCLYASSNALCEWKLSPFQNQQSKWKNSNYCFLCIFQSCWIWTYV